MATYILVHGSWAGGWQFKQVAKHLQQAGHTVYRPTLTGLGERVHLASPEIGLDTHISDIVNLLKYEELSDVTLLGYSYSGMVITGVAQQATDRIARLVYLDGYVPGHGEALANMIDAGVMTALEGAAREFGDGWRIPHNPPDAHLRTDMPLKPIKDVVNLNRPDAAAMIARAFIHCTVLQDDMLPLLTSVIVAAERAIDDPDWQYFELDGSHGDIWQTHPGEIADILLQPV